MFCPFCGGELGTVIAFCGSCGSNVHFLTDIEQGKLIIIFATYY